MEPSKPHIEGGHIRVVNLETMEEVDNPEIAEVAEHAFDRAIEAAGGTPEKPTKVRIEDLGENVVSLAEWKAQRKK